MTRLILAVIVAASAAFASTAPASPTATDTGDLLWLVLIGGVVPLTARYAHPWAVLVLGAAAGFVTEGWTLALAALAIMVVAAAIYTRQYLGLANAVAGAFAVNALLRASSPVGPDWLTLLIATVAILILALSGLPRMSMRPRLAVMGLVSVAALAAFGFAVLAAIAALSAQSDLERGVEAARQGLDQASNADIDAARISFLEAQELLDRGYDHLDQSWVRPALHVPVVGPNLHATTELAAAGKEVADTALGVSDAADPDNVVISGSRIDMAALEATKPELERARRTLLDAQTTADEVRSPWLLPPLANQIDSLDDTLADAFPTIETLLDVIDLAAPMLGSEGPRTYLVLFTTPAETRGIGGFVGNWATIGVDDGQLMLLERGRASDLAGLPDAAERTLSGPDEYLARYGRYRPSLYLVNVTASPDFPTIGGVARELFPQAGTGAVDGVILADPSTLAAFLDLTGPVTVPDLAAPLTADNLEQFLWHDQYVRFGDNEARVEQLDDLLEQLFARLTTQTLDPLEVRDTLAPLVDDNRLAVWSADPDEAEALARLGLAGSFPRIEPGEDLLSVRTANASANKIDFYLERHIAYDVEVDPETGVLDGTVTVVLVNHATDEDWLPNYVVGNIHEDLPRAFNRQWVTLYTPHQLAEMRVNGEPAAGEAHPELGVFAYSLFVDVPPGGLWSEITFDITGQVDPSHYRLRWAGQPTIRPDQLRFDISHGAGDVSFEATTSADLDLSTDDEPDDEPDP